MKANACNQVRPTEPPSTLNFMPKPLSGTYNLDFFVINQSLDASDLEYPNLLNIVGISNSETDKASSSIT